MNKKHIITGVLVASLGIAATSAFAFGPKQGGRGMDINFEDLFEDLDTNSDGQITKTELQAMGAARFDAADADGNGVLSAEEMIARAQTRVSERVMGMIERFDKDGDGALSRDEMPKANRGGRAERMFDHFDEDGSGGISEQEFNQAKAQIGERRKGRWARPGQGHGSKD